MKVALVDDEQYYLSKMEALCRAYGESRDGPMELLCHGGRYQTSAACIRF